MKKLMMFVVLVVSMIALGAQAKQPYPDWSSSLPDPDPMGYLLSNGLGDYCLTVEVDTSDDTFDFLFYGMLKEGKSLSDVSTFHDLYGSIYPNNLEEIKDDIGDQKLLVWLIVPTPAPSGCTAPPGELIPFKSQCAEITKGPEMTRQPFVCRVGSIWSSGGGEMPWQANGKDREEIVDGFLNSSDPGNIILKIAAPGDTYYSSPHMGMGSLLERCQTDVDSDGIPDQFDDDVVEPVTISDSDGDGVADGDDDCPDTETGATVDANGCSDAQLAALESGDDAPGADPDGDGIPNSADECDYEAGLPEDNGCPPVADADPSAVGPPDTMTTMDEGGACSLIAR